MSVETVPAPTRTPPAADKPDHLYCCNPDLSLCGLDMSGWEFGSGAGEDDETCPTCTAAQDGPCGDPGCPDRTLRWRLRQWWRNR